MREIRLIETAFPGRPGFDTAVSRALLLRVARGEVPECLRLYATDDVLAFSVFDRTRPGYPRAVEAARAAGFAPVLRLAGGRAAVFHRRTLAFAWSRPVDDLRVGVTERFCEMADLLVTALRRLGVDAREGEVPGEYCPGSHSVNARGRVKLAGVGQRVVRGAAHVGGVVVVADAGRVAEPLIPVYASLGYDFDPATTGSVADEVGDVGTGTVATAIRGAFADVANLAPAAIDADTRALAERLAPEHAAAGPPGAAPLRPLEGTGKGVLESASDVLPPPSEAG